MRTANRCCFSSMFAIARQPDAQRDDGPEVVRLSGEVGLHPDRGRVGEVRRKFHVEAFPTVQFISPQGVPLSRLLGKIDAEAFIRRWFSEACGPQNRMVYRGDLILR